MDELIVKSEDTYRATTDKQIIDPMEVILSLDHDALPSTIPINYWKETKPGLQYDYRKKNIPWKNEVRKTYFQNNKDLRSGKPNYDEVDWHSIDNSFGWDDGDRNAPDSETAGQRCYRQREEVSDYYFKEVHADNFAGPKLNNLRQMCKIFKTNLYDTIVCSTSEVGQICFYQNIMARELVQEYSTINIKQEFCFDDDDGMFVISCSIPKDNILHYII